MRDGLLKDLIKTYGIALTGGVATGKSTVANLIRQSGWPVIDADQLARTVTAKGTPGLALVVDAFGAEVLTADGALDRKRLGTLVFQDAAKRQLLEGITHPLIRDALGRSLQEHGLVARPRPFVYEAALIFETKSEKDFRAVWVTSCAPDVQRARLMTRSGLTGDDADRLIGSQMPPAEKAARADVVIDTGVPLEQLATDVGRLLARTR